MTSPTVLVTGSSSGLGRTTVETLARRGYTVFASMRGIFGRNASAAAELMELARSEGLALEVIEMDVTDTASVERAIETIIARTGRIDVVVNNAGYGVAGISEATSIAQMQRLFDVNVWGVHRVNQAVLPHMRRQNSGLLVYISSTSSRSVLPALGAYSASKAALDALARGFAHDLIDTGIDTTIIQAGGFSTEFGQNTEKSADTEVWSEYGSVGEFANAFVDGFTRKMAEGAVSHPRELADLIGDLIDTPQGNRPLNVAIGTGSEQVPAVNAALMANEEYSLRAFGLDRFLRSSRPTEQPSEVVSA
ncbi:MAG TPA: SDR family oxidoreductase [Roseiflexaceae bacterium]|nr:SDR family oxidoreductase [Roseiflexaceae bacterium]